MLKKIGVSLVFTLILLLAAAPIVTAKRGERDEGTKYTFNNVLIGEEVVEIEASVKDTKKNDYSTCRYYSDDYLEYLGLYDKGVAISGEEIKDWCITHYNEKV